MEPRVPSSLRFSGSIASAGSFPIKLPAAFVAAGFTNKCRCVSWTVVKSTASTPESKEISVPSASSIDSISGCLSFCDVGSVKVFEGFAVCPAQIGVFAKRDSADPRLRFTKRLADLYLRQVGAHEFDD